MSVQENIMPIIVDNIPEYDNTNDRLQGSLYDKVFKENMQENLPDIIAHVLNLDITTLEELPDDVQYTKERKTDLLKKVKDAAGNVYLLHVEYQTDNFKFMQFRMAEYSIMLQRKYDLPINQYVVYIGPGKPNMPVTIDTKDHKFRYNMTALSAVDYKLFLKSDKLEGRMLAILGKIEPKNSLPVLEHVLKDIKYTATDTLSTDRYLNQLHVLVKLRNLGQKLDEVMMVISQFFKEEEDPLFRIGQEKGEHKKAIAMAIKLKAKRTAIYEIAELTDLSVEEIESL